jgi:serine/threonine protein kinase
MEHDAVSLAAAAIPGVGPVLVAFNLVRTIYKSMQESKALCESIQRRLDATWSRLLQMEKDGTLPPTFHVTDFTDILARFHALVLKQAEKSFVVRVGTSGSFMKKLRACHEELDQLNDSFRDQTTDMLLQWRAEWERNVVAMQKEVEQLAAAGVAVQMTPNSRAESNEALATLVHEQHKLVDQDHIVSALQAICSQLARERKLALPKSMPPWFFTFDDVDIEREQLHGFSSATAMGTVHRAKWGTHTRVMVKKIALPTPSKPTSVVTWKEADVWWRLNHPNVLRMYGACHVTNPAFIVCEEATHGNILDYLTADPSRTRRFWRLQLDVAIGLAHLKANRVVHGNLKATNILIGDDGRAKISDFGFSYVRAAVDSGEESGRAIAGRGDHVAPSFESDVYAFAVCMLQLLSDNDPSRNEVAHVQRALRPKRPRGITDDAWDLIKRMSSHDPTMRLTIHQVQTRLQRLAAEETAMEGYFNTSSLNESSASSHDVDSQRAAYQQQREGGGAAPASEGTQKQQQQLQRELEDLRQKIRHEERELERLIEKRQRAQAAHAKPTTQQAGEDSSTIILPPSLTTKQLLRILRWGTTDEQTQALLAIDTNRVEHSALEIVRNNGLDIIVASMKHGPSSESRQMAIDILQSIATAGTGLYMDAVLEHSVTQVLMGILHYRRVAMEQRRAGQFLVLLATRSARARSFFLQNAGLELLIKLLWQEQLPMFDKGFKARTDPAIVDEMRGFLATHAESRTREGDHAMHQRGNHDLALQKYTEAIVLDPRNGRLYAKRRYGILYRNALSLMIPLSST